MTGERQVQHAALQYALEQTPQKIAVTKAAVTILREGRVVWRRTFESEPAELPVGQVHTHLLAQLPL